MVQIFLLIALASAPLLASVQVYRAVSCAEVWGRFESGLKDRWDERARGPQLENYRHEVEAGLDHVYQVYEDVLRKAGESREFIDEFLAGLRQEDRADLARRNFSRFLIHKNDDGAIDGVVKVTIALPGSHPRLESFLLFLDGFPEVFGASRLYS
ncbi:MAG: hypothetical protein HYZ71_08170 [Deltaproteobacteria bacterium]|nr:hypothetical protein [Deltaproteobacteria bacterium]